MSKFQCFKVGSLMYDTGYGAGSILGEQFMGLLPTQHTFKQNSNLLTTTERPWNEKYASNNDRHGQKIT